MQPHCEEIISTLDAIYLEYVLLVKVLHVLLVSCIIAIITIFICLCYCHCLYSGYYMIAYSSVLYTDLPPLNSYNRSQVSDNISLLYYSSFSMVLQTCEIKNVFCPPHNLTDGVVNSYAFNGHFL